LKKGRGRVGLVVALSFFSVTVLAGITAAKGVVYIPIGGVEIVVGGGVKPKALSRTKPTPITFKLSGEIKDVTGAYPPPLREFILEGDKNVAIDVKGLPVCGPIHLRSAKTTMAEAACRPAIIGRGHVTVTLLFAGEKQVPVEGRAIVFNGGFKGGITTLYIPVYLTMPVPTVILSTVKVKKIHKGRYGLLSVATISKVVGGDVSVTHFDLTIRKRGVLTAKCTDGRLQGHVQAVLADETTLAATLMRPCLPKG
jgi:hypothetical protein